VLRQSLTEVRTAGHSVNLAILADNIEASRAHGLVQAGLLVRLLLAGEVPSEAFVVVVTLETPVVVVALEVLTEEAAMAVEVEEATIKLKEKVSKEGHMWAFFFASSPFVSSLPCFIGLRL
jgi:hypothetical protein